MMLQWAGHSQNNFQNTVKKKKKRNSWCSLSINKIYPFIIFKLILCYIYTEQAISICLSISARVKPLDIRGSVHVLVLVFTVADFSRTKLSSLLLSLQFAGNFGKEFEG